MAGWRSERNPINSEGFDSLESPSARSPALLAWDMDEELKDIRMIKTTAVDIKTHSVLTDSIAGSRVVLLKKIVFGCVLDKRIN